MSEQVTKKRTPLAGRRSGTLRFRKNDPEHNLLAATTHWIKANGGNAVVIGGIGIIREDPLRFYVTVKVAGTPPTPASPEPKEK